MYIVKIRFVVYIVLVGFFLLVFVLFCMGRLRIFYGWMREVFLFFGLYYVLLMIYEFLL